MPIKQTVPTNSGDYLQFGNATTPVAAQIGGYEDSTGNGHLELYTTASGTLTERMRINSTGNARIGSSDTSLNSINSINTFGFKNRIINGNMAIDQRNVGGLISNPNGYNLDRWYSNASQASKYTIQKTPSTSETGYATRIGAGFTNYLAVTSTSSYAVTSTDYFQLYQTIEGFNCADLVWGTANAQPITISFWAYSSLTGSFGASVMNATGARSYPFSYTISSANTWTYCTVTVAGDTSGAWPTDNSGNISLRFSLGSGSTYSGTANTWASALYLQPVGTTSVVGTSGATLYITGVQIEKGTQATSFDHRPYGIELQLCQRYFEKSYPIGTAPATATTSSAAWGSVGAPNSTSLKSAPITFAVTKRTAPTMNIYDMAGAIGKVTLDFIGSSGNGYAGAVGMAGESRALVYENLGVSCSTLYCHFTAESEL